MPCVEVLDSSSDPPCLSLCGCRNLWSTIYTGNSHKYRNRLGEPATVRLRAESQQDPGCQSACSPPAFPVYISPRWSGTPHLLSAAPGPEHPHGPGREGGNLGHGPEGRDGAQLFLSLLEARRGLLRHPGTVLSAFHSLLPARTRGRGSPRSTLHPFCQRRTCAQTWPWSHTLPCQHISDRYLIFCVIPELSKLSYSFLR